MSASEAQLRLTSETIPMLGQEYMLSILIIHMKHFQCSPNNDSQIWHYRRYRQYIQSFLHRINTATLHICKKRHILSAAQAMQQSGEETQMMVGPIFTFSDKWHLYHPRTLYKRVRPCKLSFLILRLNTMHIQRTPAKQPQTLHREDKVLSTKVLVSHVSPAPPVHASICFFN